MVIWAPFLIFLVLFALQILLARWVKPAGEDRFIILLFVVLPAIAFAGCWFFQFFHFFSIHDAVLAYLLFFVIAVSWVVSYPAIYAASPTLIMIWLIDKNTSGTTPEELRELVGVKQNSIERIQDAFRAGFIRDNGGIIELTPIGRTIYLVFKLYRSALGLGIDAI